MRELSVSTQTTPIELAAFFDGLAPDDEIGGRPGQDGAVVLYVHNDLRPAFQHAIPEAAIAAGVAIDVVLQHVEYMPGALSLVANVRAQLDRGTVARAGWLAPPLAVLARLYAKTLHALPGNPWSPRGDAAGNEEDGAEGESVTAEQRQALDMLLARLMQFPSPSKQPGRH